MRLVERLVYEKLLRSKRKYRTNLKRIKLCFYTMGYVIYP
jgi:hypothetical protein